MGRWVQSNRPHPGSDYSGNTGGAKDEVTSTPGWEGETLPVSDALLDTSCDRLARLLGDLELHGLLRLLLHNNRASGDMAPLNHIVDAKSDQITPAHLLSMARLNNASSRARGVVAAEFGSPRSLSASAGASGRAACLCSTVLHAS